MEDFTAANIAVSDEKREEELEKVKRGKVNYSKLEAEVQEAKSNALEVGSLGKLRSQLCSKSTAVLCFEDVSTTSDTHTQQMPILFGYVCSLFSSLRAG